MPVADSVASSTGDKPTPSERTKPSGAETSSSSREGKSKSGAEKFAMIIDTNEKLKQQRNERTENGAAQHVTDSNKKHGLERSSSESDAERRAFNQAQTPKHCNKTVSGKTKGGRHPGSVVSAGNLSREMGKEADNIRGRDDDRPLSASDRYPPTHRNDPSQYPEYDHRSGHQVQQSVGHHPNQMGTPYRESSHGPPPYNGPPPPSAPPMRHPGGPPTMSQNPNRPPTGGPGGAFIPTSSRSDGPPHDGRPYQHHPYNQQGPSQISPGSASGGFAMQPDYGRGHNPYSTHRGYYPDGGANRHGEPQREPYPLSRTSSYDRGRGYYHPQGPPPRPPSDGRYDKYDERYRDQSFSSGNGPPPHYGYDGPPPSSSAQYGHQYHRDYSQYRDHRNHPGGRPPEGSSMQSFPDGRHYPPHEQRRAEYPQNKHERRPQSSREHESLTRAVSSSFAESTKSRESHSGKVKKHSERGDGTLRKAASFQVDVHKERLRKAVAARRNDQQDDDAASDSSWRQLQQVASVDKEEMRRLKEGEQKDTSKDVVDTRKERMSTPVDQQQRATDVLEQPSSRTSSLSNSPEENMMANRLHVETKAEESQVKVYPPLPTPSKLRSLDSLSSVASAQEPIHTTTGGSKEDREKKHGAARHMRDSSIGSSTTSSVFPGNLDLMQCPSGGSLVFNLKSDRKDEDESSIGLKPVGEEKQRHSGEKHGREERGDENTNNISGDGDDEIRKAPSDLSKHAPGDAPQHSSKRSRRSQRPTSPEMKDRDEGSQQKKSRTGSPTKYKASPLSITCSPPNTPGAMIQVPVMADGGRERRKEQHPPHRPQAHRNESMTMSPGYFDKSPHYSYSIDSMPPFPRDGKKDKQSFPPLPRTGSSSSSSTGPTRMSSSGQEAGSDREKHSGEGDKERGFQTMPSWDIQGQDSFGGGMTIASTGSGGGGGGQLLSSFSFNMGGYNASPVPREVGGGAERPPSRPAPHPPVAESRNQSFDYHGNFGRSRSGSHEMRYDGGPPHQPPPHFHPRDGGYRPSSHEQRGAPPSPPYPSHSFPPHAPSWGTTMSSTSHHSRGPPPSHHYPYSHGVPHSPPPGRPSYPHVPPHFPPHHPGSLMMRNYSTDSGVMSVPPDYPPAYHRGPHDHRPHPQHGPGHRPMLVPNAFEPPPPDFANPNHPNKRPPPAVYVLSATPGRQGMGPMPGRTGDSSLMGKGGVYGWSKDDDMWLTEVMKKYKNPRDWGPIAKEHGRGKTAKECHDRWIRYLKPGVRKGQWQDHEDAIVVEAVTTSTEQPFTRWSDLAQRLPGRVGKQIRDRWVNHLNPAINHMPFSREDDLLLWEGHKQLGKRWVEISTKFFNSSRSENHIKNRWYSASFKKFIANEFGPDAYSGGEEKAPDSTEGVEKSEKAPEELASSAAAKTPSGDKGET